jgi:hypothetical protein
MVNLDFDAAEDLHRHAIAGIRAAASGRGGGAGLRGG